MQSFEERELRETEPTELSGNLALLGGGLLVLLVVVVLALKVGYTDVDQATQVSTETPPPAVAIHDSTASR
jgi:hypothetical protein